MALADDLDREIRSTAVDFSFGEMLNLHKDKEIVIRPEYQRLFRWSYEQRSRLIESILLGLPIPPIFLIENEGGVLELIDGLQRVSSVLQFLDNAAINEPELTLVGCDILETLNGKKYDDLPTILKLKIKRTPIRATIINKSGDQKVKYEMFKRLNTGGSLLSAQEIRNCSSRMLAGGELFYEELQNLSKSKIFTSTITRLSDAALERRGDEELVLRFFAVTQFRNLYHGNIEEWLDSTMEKILFGESGFNIKDERARFEDRFTLIGEKLGDQGFTRFNDRGEATGRLAPAYFEAVVAAVDAVADQIRNVPSDQMLLRLQAAFSDAEFKNATGPGANSIPKLQSRINTVAKHLTTNVGP